MLTKHAFKEMYDTLSGNKEIGGVCPLINRTVYGIQGIKADKYRTFDELQRFADRVENGIEKERTLVSEDACFMIKRSVVENTGFFDEQFLGKGYEDIDFCFRMQLQKWKLMLVPVFVHHEHGEWSADVDRCEKDKQYNLKIFQNKWGFVPLYSLGIRYDLLKFMDMKKDHLSVLEVGCGCGGNFMYIRQNNAQAELYGVELNPGAAEFANLFADVKNYDIEQIKQEDWIGRFDYIIMGDVLEHLKDPWHILRKMKSFLKIGGVLIASIPNIMHISNMVNLLNGYWEYRDEGLLDRTHLRFFTRKSIVEMMNNARMTILTMEGKQVASDTQLEAVMKQLVEIKGLAINEKDLEVYQWIVVSQKPGRAGKGRCASI